MTKTKRSLFNSAISLLLCFSMLLGSTFAWFTDVATSNSNVVQSGNLNAEMYYSDELLDAGSDEWKNADGVPVFTYDNWEPGYTDVKYVKIANEGNLSFKWRLSIEAAGEMSKLADVIDVYYVNPVTEKVTTVNGKTSVGTLTGVVENRKTTDGALLPNGTYETGYTTGATVLAIALHMKEDAGNEYQNLSIGDGFELNLIATQFSYEGDSFGNSYDTNAKWPETVIIGDKVASTPVVPTADGKVGAGGANIDIDNGKYNASVPEGTKLEDGADKLTLVINSVDESQANITLDENEASLSLDVHVYGISADNDKVIKIYMAEKLPVGLNIGNYRFYHVEGGVTYEMTLLEEGATPVHNNFEYDPATGDIIVYLKSFSEVALVADTVNAWEGNFDYTWYNADATELTIANADQLAAFGAIVGGMAEGIEQDSFSGKTVKLIADVNLGDDEKNNKSNIIFYPIGYNSSDGKYEKTGVAIDSTLYSFSGTFDGNGNTIANFYHNTWEMKGDHNWYDATLQYYRDGMGLFGKIYGGTVKNLTVSNFSSDGEIATTGVIAAYADGATFENIAIFNCNPRVYNIGNGGIVGCVGWYAKEANLKTTFKNITVDNSNKISALWGSYDVPCGGIVGQYYPTSGQTSVGTPANGGIHFDNCHISAVMDVNNDVCGNYQYYAYRYAGMLIGSVRENVTINGHVYPKMDGITAENCTVHFGSWNDYYYCEFEANGHPSYSGPDDYKFSRVPHSELNFNDTNGNGIIDTESERNSVTGCKHNHTDAENNRAVYLPFNNLVTGYGWGVTTKMVGELAGVKILDREEGNSVEKFEGKVTELTNYTVIKLGDIFKYVDNGVALVPGALTVSVVSVDENSPVSATIVYDRNNWENSTITFTGAGEVKITIQDYYFCVPTTITVNVTGHAHAYDNDCDADCNICGATRETEHTEVIDEAVAPTCTATGLTEGKHCSVCNEVIVAQTTVAALGHKYNEVVTNPDCEHDGYTTYTCSVCNYSYTSDEKEALGHKYNAVVTAPTCTTEGYTTYTCDCGYSYKADVIQALGHTEVIDVAVAATCTATGLTEGKHCSVCNEVLVKQQEVAKLAHTEVIDMAVAATCTATGLTEGKHCSVCNEVLVEQTTVAALGHTIVTYAAVAATCTETGLTEGKHCSACNEILLAQTTVAALGHTIVTDAAVAATCTETGLTEGKHCSVCNEVLVAQEEVKALGHITTNFTGDFFYRVGNKNAVQLSSLFDVGKRSVVVSAEKIAGNASVEVNGTSLQFGGTGIVKVILTNDCTCDDCVVELTLEVVDAVNATVATSANSNNVVLLNDVGLHTIEVSNGYTLYGNGFKMEAKSDVMYDTMRAGFVTLDNGTLDNVQIICPNFSYAIIYNNQIKNAANTAKPSDDSNDARGNVRSAVMATGNSKIVNSYVHGGRAAIFLRSGNLLVDSSTISGGAAANIHALSAQSLTLRNATLIQKPFEDNVHSTGKTLMGFSVLLECGEDGNSTPVILEGTLIQDAWINENYVKYTPSEASSIVKTALSKANYLHDLDGDGNNESLNLGFTYIPQNTGGNTAANVTDNRTNKTTVPYAAVDVETVVASAKVYSYKNTNGTSEEFKNVGDYVASAQSATPPMVSFTDTNDDRVFETKFDENDGRWESTLTIDLKSNYDFKFANLLVQKHGSNLSYTVKTVDGETVIDTSKTIAVNSTGVTEYILIVTDGDVIHTIYFAITATKREIPAPEVADTTGGTPLLVVKSKNSDWTVGLPALEGMKIKYYTANGDEVILDLASLTPSSTGKQNATNNFWETSKDGYKLKVTCGVIHDTKSVYGMPVVVDNNGTKQMYFTISNTNGYVSTGTSARSVNLTYEFTDPNGKTLTFTKNYNVKYADYKDVAQYKYDDFIKGTMTDTLTSSSGGGITECVTPDTLITLADGTQVRVDSLTGSEELLVWNMETGKLDKAPIMFVDSDPTAEYEIIKLKFSDGTEVKVISEHGFWDYDLNRYVYLDKNAADYIGHTFAKQNGDTLEKVTLVDVVIETELTTAWSPVTVGHLCYFVNGMLSMPGGVGGLFNIFEVDPETMTYDYEQLAKDIETYGLYTYEELNAICPLTEEMFYAAGGAYLKISIGKGNMTLDELIEMINRYSKYI